MKLLAEERRALGINEIAKATGLAPATVHRALATLLRHDWVEQNARTSRYHLGFGLLGTAAAALAYTPLVQKAQGILQRMSAVSEYNSWLGVLVGRRVAYLARAEGAKGMRSEFSAGVLQPAHTQSSGKILLAGLAPAERKRLYRGRRLLRGYTEKTITDPVKLEAELLQIGIQGYALDCGELRDSVQTIAVPVRGSDAGVIAALTTGGHQSDVVYLKSLLPELKFLADELSLDISLSDE